MNTSKRLHRLADLSDVHMGRMVQVEGITGQLVGSWNIAGRVQLVLIVGGSRMFTDALDEATEVEVWKEKA